MNGSSTARPKRNKNIGLGFLWCTIDLIKHATSIVIAGLCVLAKLPWIVLKSILRKLDDYILTPPLMEERSKSKLHFHLQIFCQPFKPCWASAMCSKCNFEQDWDDRPAGLSGEDTNDFCVLRCVNCREEIVKCRHCEYNFQLNDIVAMGKAKRSKDGRAKKKGPRGSPSMMLYLGLAECSTSWME